MFSTFVIFKEFDPTTPGTIDLVPPCFQRSQCLARFIHACQRWWCLVKYMYYNRISWTQVPLSRSPCVLSAVNGRMGTVHLWLKEMGRLFG